MYELVLTGFGDEMRAAIGFTGGAEIISIAHHFPKDVSAMDALALVGAFNTAYDRGHGKGIKYCETTHIRPTSAWYTESVGGEAKLKSERRSDVGYGESK